MGGNKPSTSDQESLYRVLGMILLRHLVAFGEVIHNATAFQVVRYNDDILQKAQCHLLHGALGFPDTQDYTSDILPEASTLEAQSTPHRHHLRSHAVANKLCCIQKCVSHSWQSSI